LSWKTVDSKRDTREKKAAALATQVAAENRETSKKKKGEDFSLRLKGDKHRGLSNRNKRTSSLDIIAGEKVKSKARRDAEPRPRLPRPVSPTAIWGSV